MIEVSEPLPESKIGLNSIHNMILNGKRIGYVDVGYMQKEDVKIFQKYIKRKLKAGQPFSMQVFIDTASGIRTADLGAKGLKEIVEALKEKFSGLEERNIYILEFDAGKKNIIGRASNL